MRDIPLNDLLKDLPSDLRMIANEGASGHFEDVGNFLGFCNGPQGEEIRIEVSISYRHLPGQRNRLRDYICNK